MHSGKENTGEKGVKKVEEREKVSEVERGRGKRYKKGGERRGVISSRCLQVRKQEKWKRS